MQVDRRPQQRIGAISGLARMLHQASRGWRRTGASGRRCGARAIAVAIARANSKPRRAWTSQVCDRQRAEHRTSPPQLVAPIEPPSASQSVAAGSLPAWCNMRASPDIASILCYSRRSTCISRPYSLGSGFLLRPTSSIHGLVRTPQRTVKYAVVVPRSVRPGTTGASTPSRRELVQYPG